MHVYRLDLTYNKNTGTRNFGTHALNTEHQQSYLELAWVKWVPT